MLTYVRDLSSFSDSGNSPVKRLLLKSSVTKCRHRPISCGTDPENLFPCRLRVLRLCNAAMPDGTGPVRTLRDRSRFRVLVSDQNPGEKFGFPEKWLLERLRLFRVVHFVNVLGIGPSRKLFASESLRNEEQLMNKLLGNGPDNEFSDKSRNLIELMVLLRKLGLIVPERAL